MSYSQNKEENIILNYFGSKVGRFVEIGAYHPIQLSNTRALVERGWSGIYIEANKRHVDTFEAFYQNEKQIETIFGALSLTDEPVTFYGCNDAVGTTDVKHKQKWSSLIAFDEGKTVPAFSIENLIKRTTGFDFLSLDTEGTSYQLFSFMPDEYLQSLSLICIEHDTKIKDINYRMKGLGFKNLDLNGENAIYGK